MWPGFEFEAGLMTSKDALGLRASYLLNLSQPQHRLAIKGRQKRNLAHWWSDKLISDQYLIQWSQGCSCYACGGGRGSFCLGYGPGCDVGSLFAEVGGPSILSKGPSLGKAPFSQEDVLSVSSATQFFS